MHTSTSREQLPSWAAHAPEPSGRRGELRGVAVRIFLTCWMVFVLHFATNTVREIYPALSLGDHLSFDVSEYLGFHPDVFELPGRGGYINNNPGASILGAIPYVLTRPLIDRIVEWQQHQRAGGGDAAHERYDTIYPMAREFYQKARERGFDVKFGLGAAVMQALCMAPLSALSAVVMFYLLVSRTASVRRAAALACLYAIATPVLFRTAQLNQNLLVADCALFAFALLWRPWADPASARPGCYLGAGLLTGWAVVCDYSGVVVVAAMSVYALARWRALPAEVRVAGVLAWFVVGVLTAGAVLLGYQWLCFGNPLYPAQQYMPPATYTHLGYVGMDWPHLDLLWATAFDIRFGLFTSAPLLLLALYPPAWFSRRVRLVGAREAACLAFFCVLFFVFCSANQYGRMQFNSGVRHVVPVVPFLFLIAAGTLLRIPATIAACVAVVTAYWSWCLAMYRDVEQGLGVFESLIHVTLEGFRLPWLTTLAHMGYVPHPSAVPLLLVAAALIWALWGVDMPQERRRRRQRVGRSGRMQAVRPQAVRTLLLVLLTGVLASRPAAAQSPALAFSTYLGGADEDTIRDIVADGLGNTYITGGARSANFPATAGAYDTTPNGNMDVFVAKLDPSGQLVWATLLGGPNYDRAYAIELDSQGNVVVAGRAGVGFPTTAGVVQPAFAGDTMPNALYGPQDGFIAKLSPDGRQLLWSTYWGTDDDCIIRDIALDAADNLYPASCIESGHVSSYISPGAFQTAKAGMRDGIVAKLTPTAAQVVWCTYVGGTANDGPTPSIRADDTGVYLVTQTSSTDEPTTIGAYRRMTAGGIDMYVAKLSPDGTQLLWGTYLGGSGDEFSETHAAAIDAQHQVYVAATTSSPDFPTTPGVVQRTYGGTGGAGTGSGTNYPGDGFVAKLSADGSQLLASTFIGGSAGEGIEGVTVAADGSVYVSGATFSSDFPTTGDAVQTTSRGGGDAFAARLAADFSRLLYSTYLGGSAADFGRASFADSSDSFYVAGMSQSNDWPAVSAAQSTRRGDWDGVVAKLAPAPPTSGLCPGAAPIERPRLRLAHLDAPGASTLNFSGEFDVPPGFPGLASAADGVRIGLEDLGRGNALVLLLDVGPGADPNACGTGEGWKTATGRSLSIFRTHLDAVTDATGSTCLGPGSAKGLVRVKASQTGSHIKFKIAARHASLTATGPLRASVVLGAGTGSTALAQGYCGTIAFGSESAAPPACQASMHNATLSRISCK